MAILYKKHRIKMEEYRIRTGGAELVAARGKIPNNSNPFFAIAAYIAPSLPTKKKKTALDMIVEAITKIKTDNRNPYICVGGDFNRLDTSEITALFPDILREDSPHPHPEEMSAWT